MKRAIALISIVILSACSAKSNLKSSYKESKPDEKVSLVMAAAEPLASAAAEKMIEAGGNLADAVVAASFVTSVTRPQSTGLGGGGFLLFRDGKTGKTEAWDFRETAPLTATPDMFLEKGEVIPDASLVGAKAVAVPGLVAGLYEFHQAHGKLPWAQVLQPAIDAAENGTPASKHFVKFFDRRKDLLMKAPGFEVFLKEGRPLRVGETFVQKDLAMTLRGVAEGGKDYFYKGQYASSLVEWMRRNGGLISRKDMESYRVRRREALRSSWKDFEVFTMPPPSSGGVHLLQILNIVESVSENFKKSFPDKDAEGLPIGYKIAEIEAFRRAFIDRAYFLGDPGYVQVPQKQLLSASYLQGRAKEIEQLRIAPAEKILPWSEEKAAKQTTHIAAMDGEGNVISTTQTINFFFGSTVIASGTGVILNDEMDDFSIKPGTANLHGLVGGQANEIRAGKRPLSSMTPTIVVDKKGQPRLAIGASDGSKIITKVYRVLNEILSEKNTPIEALNDCRFHHQWTPDKLLVEERCVKSFAAFKKYYTVEPYGFPGEVNTVGKGEGNGGFFALPDPRGQGSALIVTTP